MRADDLAPVTLDLIKGASRVALPPPVPPAAAELHPAPVRPARDPRAGHGVVREELVTNTLIDATHLGDAPIKAPAPGEPAVKRFATVLAAALLATLTACSSDAPPAPPSPSPAPSISVVQADQFKLDFAYAVPQLKDATTTDVRKILIGTCDPTSDEALVVDQLVERVLGSTPTAYQKDSLINSANALCPK